MAEEWPADVRAALARSALRKGDPARSRGPLLSMPAAELFGPWAVVEAVSRARGGAPDTVTAIGDCDPAAAALNAASGGNPQMRALTGAARRLCSQWLAVSVPRALNTDADRLSHPSRLEAVRAAARAAGLRVETAAIPQACWRGLREAMTPQAGKRKGRGAGAG